MPNPTYENDLVLLSTFIGHDGFARPAQVTYALDDAGVNISAQQWADGCQSAFADNLKTRLDNNCSILRTTALKGDGTDVFTTGLSTAAPTQGTGAFSSTAPNCALLVRKSTGFGGRTNRGRMYFPWMVGVGGGDEELGRIDSGWVADCQNKMDDWLLALEGEDGNHMVLANRVYNLPWDNPNRRLVSVNKGLEVTSLVVENVIATQRRRLDR